MNTLRNTLTDRLPDLAWALFFLVAAFGTAYWVYADQLEKLLRFGSDSLGYYQFLPAVFIDHDLQGMPWVTGLPDGRTLSIFSIGVALMQLPFFVLGHALAAWGGWEANGYSTPYAVAQLFGAAFYLALSMVLLRRCLRMRLPGIPVWPSLLLLYLGTNLYYYTAFEAFMSHGYSFFLFAALWYLTEKQLAALDPIRHVLLFVVAALIVLVRPLNGVVLLFPLLYRAKDLAAVQERLAWAWRMPAATLLGLGIAALLVLPQLLYWNYASGQWLLFTYGTKGEGFDWGSPHLFDLLISHQNGWFVYSPLMLFVLAMLFWQARQRGNGARSMLLVWGITWYLYGCWWAWWLGGAFGYRGFVEYTALLSLPLALLLERVRTFKPTLRLSAWGALGFMVFLNLRLSFLYRSPWDGPDWTWGRFWHEVGRAFWVS